MVGQHCERSTLEEIPEVLEGGIDGEQLATERAVVPFARRQLAGKESKRTPLAILVLLKDCAKGKRRSVNSNRSGCICVWMD